MASALARDGAYIASVWAAYLGSWDLREIVSDAAQRHLAWHNANCRALFGLRSAPRRVPWTSRDLDVLCLPQVAHAHSARPSPPASDSGAAPSSIFTMAKSMGVA